MQKIIFTLIVLFGINYVSIFGQPFQVCSGPGQNSCTCQTAPKICTINELNGYNFQMSTYQHPADGPTPMCSPPPTGGGTTSNNPTWVAFLAWCTDFDLLLSYSGCSNAGGTRGLQAAIYSDCSNLPGSTIECATGYGPGFGCVNNGSRTLTVSGLTIGQTYYLLVDGCNGSACNVTITVTSSTSCVQEIGAWPGDIMGEQNVCVGSTHDYTVEVPLGGIKFPWYLDGVPVGGTDFVPPNTTTTYTQTWTTVGTHTLCVDTYNGCVPVTANPAQKCITINVYDAEAGMITAQPTPVCPTETVNINVTGSSTETGISQYILIVDASGTIVKVHQGTSTTFTWPTCGVFTAYSYNYVTALGLAPVEGDPFSSIQADCTSNTTCCELESATFEFADNIAPVITGLPPDITVDCFVNIPPMPDLPFTDNCLGSGTVIGVQTDDYTNCDGGTITRTWEKTDSCGNTDTKTQVITLLPVPVATFTPYENITVTCDLFPPTNFLPTLTYNNGSTGACQIAGTIIPVRTVDTLNCMGTVTYVWEVEDICMRTIYDDQVYTVEPPLEANFINPPADVTVSCVNFPVASFLPPLSFTNGQTGICQVVGQIIPYQTVDTANCEGTVTFTWEGLDRCGRQLMHEQVWTIEPPADIAFQNVPPDTATITCAQIPAAGVLPPLVYSNGEPAGRCRIMGTVIPVRTDSYDKCGGQLEYLWEKTDSCGRYISYSQVLFVTPAPEAVWINPPADVTLACGQTVPAGLLPPLSYSNGAPTGSFCEIAGSVIPSRVDDIQGCDGTVTYTWEITDECGRPLAYSQIITLSPPNLPVWVNPPADITVTSCSGYNFDELPPLFYNNGQTGPGCGITGSVNATRDGSLTGCQGAYTYTWTYTDPCGRTITHIRTVSVVPPPPPVFVNPPANTTVTCVNEPDDMLPVLLNYTNSQTGMCLISGAISALPTVVDNPDCSKVYTYEWSFTDNCDRTITHTQVINVDPPLPAAWINPLPSITVASCDGFNFDELPPLFYNNNQTLNGCGIAGSVPPVRTGDVTDCMGAYTYTWEFMDNCGRTITHTRTVTVVPPPAAVFVNPPASTTVTCENAPNPSAAVTLNYTNSGSGTCLISGSISATPVVVDNPDCSKVFTYMWEFTDACNRTNTHTQVITVDPPLPATWINPPSSLTVASCDGFNFDELPLLFYNNNQTLNSCGIEGSVPPVRTGDVIDCQGVYTYTWEFMDNCGRTITHVRTVTVVPPPAPAFVNPPASSTVTCENAPNPGTAVLLNYTNNGTGMCLISGSISASPVVVDNPDCSKVFTYMWEFTDACNRTITHTQVITVDPPLPAGWINPPSSITVASCDPFNFDELPPLFYNNNQTLNSCGIAGSVPAVRTGDVTDCQGVYTYTWEFMDNCGRTITHVRTVTIVPPPAPAFVNPPPSETLSCVNAPDPTQALTLNYTNGAAGTCLISGDVSATPTVVDNPDCSKVYTYLWEFTDACNRTITYTKTVNILPPPPATFVNPPANATFTCVNAPDLTVPQNLNYTNGVTGSCQISGSVAATVTSNIVNCQGTHTLVWEFTDNCNRLIQWTQVITVLPPVDASFVNPPPAISTVTCENEPNATVLPVLNVSNNSSGACLINGSVEARLNVVENNCAKTYTYVWEFTDFCNRTITYTQVVNVLPPPVATLINAPVYTSLSCDAAETFSAPDIDYSNNSTCLVSGVLTPVVNKNFTACGGNIQISWVGTDICNRPLSYNQIITVNAAPNPTITTAIPDDVTVSCQDISSYAIPLEYSNGIARPCVREGIIAPVLQSNYTLCGGTATITWSAKDECNFSLNASQTITILPAPAAIFLDLPPANIQVACTDVPPVPPTLNYSNNETGFCGINGTVSPITTGGFTACGGTIQYTYQFTDACGRSIVYNQNVSVLPADDPFFTSDPVDELLPCLQGFTPPLALNYTNGLVGPCAITGSVNATTEDLGTTRIYTWTYKNACTGLEITADQEVTLRPVPNIVADQTVIDICYGSLFDLADINITDLNNTNITLTYHSGTPASAFNEIPQTVITTDAISTYYILATNEFGCIDEVKIEFRNLFGPQAGIGQTVTICNDGRSLNLWTLLTQPYDNSGYWSDTYGTGINISNPMSVSFAGQLAGNYPFDYIVPSTNLCPDGVATVQVELVDPGNYNLLEISCSPDFQTYAVKIQIFGYSLTTSMGTITTNGSIWTISNIPIGQNVTLTLKSNLGDCADATLTLNPPQCNCPVVPAPVSAGNQKACQNQIGVNIAVTVGTGLTAQWFDALSGGILLQDQSLTYGPPTTNVGITTYYVQALDPLNGCFSIRIPVIFEVQPNPVANDVTLETCDDNTDGIALFDLTKANPLLITGGGFTFKYYLSLADALAGVNPFVQNQYTNTSNNQIIFASVTNLNGCKDIAQITLSVLPIPDVTFTVNNEKCFGANDGNIFVNPPFTGLEFKLNNLPWTTNAVFDNLAPATYSIQVRDGDNCVSTYSLTVNPGQRITFSELTLNCSSNGTASNANDDTYTIKINVNSNPASNNTFTIRYLGKDLGSFTYNNVHTVIIPADGSSGILEIKDNITGCSITRSIGPLIPCSTDCEVSLSNLNVVCDNNNTDADASDDIYTISFTASIVNGGLSTSFTLLINNVISGTYNYGVPVSFTLPADGSTPDIKVRDLLNIQCITNLPVGNLTGCSGACSITSTISNIVCNDNGTINDPNDDTFTFTIRASGFNISDGWRLNGNTTIYPYNTNIVLGPYAISGGNLSLNLTDRLDANCQRTVQVPAPPPCSTPCVLQVNNVVIGNCDNNNTGNTAADDKFSITFVVNVISGSTNFYNVTVGSLSFGPFTYGQTATINGLPANNLNLTLIVTDAINSGCTVQFVVKQTPCSTCPQVVSAGPDVQLTCAQNTATLSGSTTSPGGIFVWSGPNNFNQTGQTVTTSAEGNYTLSVTFPDQCVATDVVSVAKDANLPVSNAGPNQELTCNITNVQLSGTSNLTSNVTYTWTNAAGSVIGTTAVITVSSTGFYYLEVTNTLNNCKSGKDEVEVFNRNQQLTFNIKSWVCDNSGTASTGDDDEYTINFNLANSTNATNQYQIFYQGVLVGLYNYNQNVQLLVPADGNLRQYEFIDVVTGCKTTTSTGPFISCSTNCLINFSDPVVNCNDNGTESIDTDDVYTITFNVTALNGGPLGSFSVTVDGVAIGNYSYGNNVVITLPADGRTPFIILKDLSIDACQAVVTVPALNPCSSTCTISPQVSNIICNDNGTINDPSDDIFFYDVIVQGLNTSTGWKVVGTNTVNAYNTRVTLGPIPISGGPIVLSIVDNISANCLASINVVPPAVCSEPCVINMSDLEILSCNDNNTGTLLNDDFFGINFKVNRLSGSATNYTVSDGINTYGPYIYGELVTINNLSANGNNITLLVSDPSNSGCATQFNVSKAPCSACNQVADAGLNQLITCTNNIVTLSGTGTAGGTYLWTGPGNFSKTGNSVTTSTPGVYYLTITYPNLCLAKDSVIVTKDANVPDALGGPDKVINCLVTEVQITGSTNASGTLNLVWTDANGNQIGTGSTVSVTTPGSYYFEVINIANNCSSGKDEIIVIEDKIIPEATIIADPGNLLDCIVGTIVLSGKPVANVIFNWQTGESFIMNQPSITIKQDGTVTMIAVDTLNGCENSTTIEIIDLQDYPILITTPAEPITCVNNGVYISAGESPEGLNLVFTWFDGTNRVIPNETNDSLYVVSPGTYYVMLTDTLNGCANRDTFVVERIGDFPQLNVSNDITLYCGINTTSLTVSVLNPTSPTSLLWNSTNGNILSPLTQSTVNVRGEGTYEVQVIYPISGCKTIERVEVEVNSDYPSEFVSAINDESCKDEKDGSISITSIKGGQPPLNLKLNGTNVGSNTNFTPLSAGSYIIEVTDANGCKYDTTLVVDPGIDINLFATSPLELVYNQSQIIELITNLKPDEIASIKWTPSDNLTCDTCLVTTLTAKTNVTYVVEIVDVNGCSESVTITIRVRDNVIITTPNIINPGSGFNKFFTVYGNESVINIEKLSIYDRWGNLVFIKENFKPNIPTEGWDGTFNGQDVVPGVFVFLVNYLAPSGVKTLTGDITVIR